MRTRRRQPRGFSLVEVMISMGLLAFSLVGLAQIQIAAVATNRMASKMNQASRAARDLVDAAKQWNINDPRLSTGTIELTSRDDLDAKVAEAIKDFTETPSYRPAFCQGCSSTSEAGNLDDYAAFPGPRLPEGFKRYWQTFTLVQNGKRAGRLIVVAVKFPLPGPNGTPIWKTNIQTSFRYDQSIFTDF